MHIDPSIYLMDEENKLPLDSKAENAEAQRGSDVDNANSKAKHSTGDSVNGREDVDFTQKTNAEEGLDAQQNPREGCGDKDRNHSFSMHICIFSLSFDYPVSYFLHQPSGSNLYIFLL